MDDVSELSHQFGISVAVVHILEYLKNSNLPFAKWITPYRTGLIRLVALGLSVATSIGFKFAVTQGGLATGGVLTVGFPAVATMIDVVIHTIAQYGAQKGYYHLAIRQTDVDALKAFVTDLVKPKA